jgi:hypothetical protein
MTSGETQRRGAMATAVAAMLGASIVIGFQAVEIAYRGYLFSTEPDRLFHSATHPSFLFFRNSIWTYDNEVGYRYKPNKDMLAGNVTDGKLIGCDGSSRIDENGNVGESGRDSANADFKVLVFGDPVTAQPNNNKTYSSFLEAALSKRMGRRVSVINMGRDGYGILQMVDLAAIEIPTGSRISC